MDYHLARAGRFTLGASIKVCLVLSLMACPSHGASSRGWDWSGIIGTGQSLSVGAKPVLSTNQAGHNLKLSTGHLPWPVDPADSNLTLVPLLEPVGRLARGFPSSWPENLYGETPHSAMASQITALVLADLGRDFISIHSAVGESGKGIALIKKGAVSQGLNGRAYEAALIETRAISRLAETAHKEFGVGAVVLTHGEADAGNTNYEAEVRQLWRDFDTDLRAITGQSERIQLIVSQQNSCNDFSPSTQAQWKMGVDPTGAIVCAGPKYQYCSTDAVHLTPDGYRQLGEKFGEVYYERVVRGRLWQPLYPTEVERTGNQIKIHFHVPVPPLIWETNFEEPHKAVPEWSNGKGFEVTDGGRRIPIAAVEISSNIVVITCRSNPGEGARVSYAMIRGVKPMSTPYPGTLRWGLLRDSDPFKGAVTGVEQPNYSVAFEMTVP